VRRRRKIRKEMEKVNLKQLGGGPSRLIPYANAQKTKSNSDRIHHQESIRKNLTGGKDNSPGKGSLNDFKRPEGYAGGGGTFRGILHLVSCADCSMSRGVEMVV